ncbi:MULTISPECIES: hypothetical protein [unclassified Mycobacterium]|uniref:hypothetical protein n=1 Tax=unclassified Mycobacterium TaxID=2642494 RepID=UPI000B2331D5|nr:MULTISPECIES: hypothetical protein [unclassified Mycobacterium]
MKIRESLRPCATMGVALVAASAVITAPGAVPGAAAHTVGAGVALTSLGWTDVEFLTPDGWEMFDSAVLAQAYADDLTATTLSYGQTAVEWAGWLEPFLSFAGISGLADWVSDRYDLFTDILAPGWDPLPWFAGFFESIGNDPNILFGPMADIDLGWVYGLLGISAEDGDQLNSLLELASGYAGGMLTWELMGIYAVVPGAINAVVDGTISLDDLFPEAGSQLDLLANLAGESMMNWLTSTEETLTNSMDEVIDILENSPGVQWILDIVSQLSDGAGVELPF